MWKGGRVGGCTLISSCENFKIATHCRTTIDRRMLNLTKKDTPGPRAKKPQQDGRRGKIIFRNKPHTHQRSWEGSNKTLCAPGPRDLTETEPDLPLSVFMSPGEAQAQQCPARGTGSLAAADLGHSACALSLLGGGHHQPHHRAAKQTTHKLQNNYIKFSYY